MEKKHRIMNAVPITNLRRCRCRFLPSLSSFFALSFFFFLSTYLLRVFSFDGTSMFVARKRHDINMCAKEARERERCNVRAKKFKLNARSLCSISNHTGHAPFQTTLAMPCHIRSIFLSASCSHGGGESQLVDTVYRLCASHD